jgi:F-type H+-transporting ATPase subunit delta
MSVAKSYAKAFYETAREAGQAGEPLERELEQFIAMIDQSRDAEIALFGPVTSSKEKVLLVETIGRKMALSESTIRFLTLLARKERLPILSKIHDALSEVRLAAEGGVSGKLVSAEPMSASDVEGLAAAFGKKLNKKVAFRISSDPALLAGMKVTVNGVTYDGTLRSQLQRLRDQVAAGVNQ